MRGISIVILGMVVGALGSTEALSIEKERRNSHNGISCPGEVRECVNQQRASLLPTNEQQDWTLTEVNTTHKRQFVRFEATWQGMRTLGSTAVVTLDAQGNILFVDGGARTIEVEPHSSEITETEARRIAMDALHSSRGGVIPMGERAPVERLVHVDGYTGTIVYEVKVGLPGEMGVAFVYVNSGNGHVLWVRNPVQH